MKNPEIDFLVDFIFESDAIEGILDDKDLLRRQLEAGYRQGHAAAILLLDTAAENHYLINESSICCAQGLITAEQHLKPGGLKLRKAFVGRYRNVNVSVGGRTTINPITIPEAMKRLVNETRDWQRSLIGLDPTSVLEKVADFHFYFERIHPFADGNGRTGRALVYYLLKFAGLNPFIFTNSDKFDTYYKCFERPAAMREYFLKKFNA